MGFFSDVWDAAESVGSSVVDVGKAVLPVVETVGTAMYGPVAGIAMSGGGRGLERFGSPLGLLGSTGPLGPDSLGLALQAAKDPGKVVGYGKTVVKQVGNVYGGKYMQQLGVPPALQRKALSKIPLVSNPPRGAEMFGQTPPVQRMPQLQSMPRRRQPTPQEFRQALPAWMRTMMPR